MAKLRSSKHFSAFQVFMHDGSADTQMRLILYDISWLRLTPTDGGWCSIGPIKPPGYTGVNNDTGDTPAGRSEMLETVDNVCK